jgi:hypothetical protein
METLPVRVPVPPPGTGRAVFVFRIIATVMVMTTRKKIIRRRPGLVAGIGGWLMVSGKKSYGDLLT